METNNVKLTDNEIIKALECCSCETLMYCEDQCPFYKQCEKDENLCKFALALINRQKVDLENYKRIAENQQSVSMDKEVEIKRLRAEIERLQKENHLFADIGKMYSEVRAEAVKEFASDIERYKTNIFIKGEELIIMPLCDFEEIKKWGLRGNESI